MVTATLPKAAMGLSGKCIEFSRSSRNKDIAPPFRAHAFRWQNAQALRRRPDSSLTFDRLCCADEPSGTMSLPTCPPPSSHGSPLRTPRPYVRAVRPRVPFDPGARLRLLLFRLWTCFRLREFCSLFPIRRHFFLLECCFGCRRKPVASLGSAFCCGCRGPSWVASAL